MNKIKVIWTYIPSKLQDSLDEWMKEENPNIINSSIAVGENYAVISVVYSNSPERNLSDLLKS